MAQINEGDFNHSVELGVLPDVRMTFQIMALHVRKVSRKWTYPSHEHSMFEIHWMVDGEQQMIVDGSLYDQRKGDVLIIKPGATHSCKNAGANGFTYMSVHFSVDDREVLGRLSGLADTYFSAASALSAAITPSLSNLRELACEGGISSAFPASKRMKVFAAVFDLLGAMGEHLSRPEEETLTESEIFAGQISEQIEAAVKGTIIHGLMEDERTWISDIAKRFKISPSQLNRIFQSRYGKSPRRYMSEIMLQEAKRLLIQKSLSVDRVAMMLGYKTGAHFTRQFKRWTGETPSAFRRFEGQA